VGLGDKIEGYLKEMMAGPGENDGYQFSLISISWSSRWIDMIDW
jgi:hypothetical protein